MARQKNDGNHSPPKNNIIQDSEVNEKNGYPVPDCNKIRINDAKEEILPVITENFMEMLLDMVN
jgi:hypothetical protein